MNETLLEEPQLDQRSNAQNDTATAAQETAAAADLERKSLENLAPRPNNLADTGLDQTFLSDLTAKHLLDGGILTLADLTKRMALAGPIVRQLLEFMRAEARIEVRGLGLIDGHRIITVPEDLCDTSRVA